MIVLKCPVCGAPLPPPVRKGGMPRKYCSVKCGQKAAVEKQKGRGYRRPKSHRHVCVICGETFYSDRADSKCCGVRCGHAYAALKKHDADGVRLSGKTLAILAKKEAKRRALEACRETAPVTVEERDLRNSELGQIVRVRVETRGRFPCGSFCPRYVKQN